MTFCSSSTDLDVMTLGAPHNQVREAPSAVPEVHGQAAAHATEDGAPQAGHKILDRRYRDGQPSPGMETLEPPVMVRQGRPHVSFSRDGVLRHQAPFCPWCWHPSLWGCVLLGQLPSFHPVGNM